MNTPSWSQEGNLTGKNFRQNQFREGQPSPGLVQGVGVGAIRNITQTVPIYLAVWSFQGYWCLRSMNPSPSFIVLPFLFFIKSSRVFIRFTKLNSVAFLWYQLISALAHINWWFNRYLPEHPVFQSCRESCLTCFSWLPLLHLQAATRIHPCSSSSCLFMSYLPSMTALFWTGWSCNCCFPHLRISTTHMHTEGQESLRTELYSQILLQK